MSPIKNSKPVTTKPRDATPPIEPMALSIRQFVDSHGISIDSYFKMARAGIGPRVMKVGARTLISREAAEAWRRDREQAAQQQQRRKGGREQASV
jgi:hypothetical protein